MIQHSHGIGYAWVLIQALLTVLLKGFDVFLRSYLLALSGTPLEASGFSFSGFLNGTSLAR